MYQFKLSMRTLAKTETQQLLIARRWFDTEKMDAIADMPLSSAALAVQEVARNAKKTLLISGADHRQLDWEESFLLSRFSTHWTEDTRALTSAVVQGVTQSPGDTWFFVTVDYALGQPPCSATHQLRSRGRMEKSSGGVRFPLGTPDLSFVSSPNPRHPVLTLSG